MFVIVVVCTTLKLLRDHGEKKHRIETLDFGIQNLKLDFGLGLALWTCTLDLDFGLRLWTWILDLDLDCNNYYP